MWITAREQKLSDCHALSEKYFTVAEKHKLQRIILECCACSKCIFPSNSLSMAQLTSDVSLSKTLNPFLMAALLLFS